MPECCDAMLAYAYQAAAAGFAATGLELLPGVKELLSRLVERDDVIVALVTGNLERIAWIKMKALGIEGSFTKPGIGGFGSDDTNRGALVRIARKRCLEKLGCEVRTAVHVGDTPNDVSAAEFGGAKAIAVTTGVFDAAVKAGFPSARLEGLGGRESGGSTGGGGRRPSKKAAADCPRAASKSSSPGDPPKTSAASSSLKSTAGGASSAAGKPSAPPPEEGMIGIGPL